MASKKGSKGRKSSGKRGTAKVAKKKSPARKPLLAKGKVAKKKSRAVVAAAKPAAKKKPVAKAKPAKAKLAKAKPAKAKPAKAKLAKAKPVKAKLAKAKPAKAIPAKAKPAKAALAKAKPAVRRRENGGRIEKTYGRELLARGGPREKEGSAFVGGPRATDDLAQELGEEFVETVTSGEDEGEDVLNQEVPEERGGPFIVTTAGTEFADGVDESNPKGTKPEPFPRT
jgi:hypothetical protein